MALSKIDVANMLTGTTPVANGGTGVTSVDSIGNLVKISSQTVPNGTASVEFTSGIDSTYRIHIFRYNAIDSGGGNTELTFAPSTSNDGTGYGIATTCSFASAYSQEGGTSSALQNESSYDSHNDNGNIPLSRANGTGSDEIQSMDMTCYDWANTTHVKPFRAVSVGHHQADYSIYNFVGGFINTTSAIQSIRFKLNSGTLNGGVITLYGVRT
jgi:hypothetical protein